MDMTEFFHAEE